MKLFAQWSREGEGCPLAERENSLWIIMHENMEEGAVSRSFASFHFFSAAPGRHTVIIWCFTRRN